MKRTAAWLAPAGLLLMLALPGPLHANDEWRLLGTKKVSHATEKDVVEVGQQDGKYKSIRIDVTEGKVELFDIRVVFANGEDFSPTTRLVFQEGERSRVIDMPGDARAIRRVEFAYRNLEPRGQAVVNLYGRELTGSDNGPPSTEGWEVIGSREVDFRADRDVLEVGGKKAYRRLMLGVDRGDVEIHNVKVTFANGDSFSPDTRLHFDADTRTRAIDLPGALRDIRRIEFRYRSLRGGNDGRAIVRVFGRK